MRVGRMPISAIKGTRDVLDTAGRVVKGLAEAGKTVVEEIQEQLTAPEKETEGSVSETTSGTDDSAAGESAAKTDPPPEERKDPPREDA